MQSRCPYPRMDGHNGEAGESPVLTRNCNLAILPRKPGRPPESVFRHSSRHGGGNTGQTQRNPSFLQDAGVFLSVYL